VRIRERPSKFGVDALSTRGFQGGKGEVEKITNVARGRTVAKVGSPRTVHKPVGQGKDSLTKEGRTAEKKRCVMDSADGGRASLGNRRSGIILPRENTAQTDQKGD